MTTAVETIETEVAQRLAHRKACAYLKGYIVGYGSSRGMKWDGDPDRTPEFKQGMEDSRRGNITFVHILYNRMRHSRPHLASYDLDSNYMTGWKWMAERLAEFGYDVNEAIWRSV